MTDSTRRTVRTAVQLAVGLLTALPALVESHTLPSTLPGLGVALAVSTGLTRVMAIPAVDQVLPSWLKRQPATEEASPR